MQDLTVTLIQTDLVWENIEANLAGLDTKINGITDSTDVIILPEMFSTGFSMAAERLAESMDGSAIQWLKAKASETGVSITGSLMIRDNDRFYNRLIWARPDGSIACYDKKHLFRYAGEDKIFTPGHRSVAIKQNDWRIRPWICYDLRFPIWTRNLAPYYDLALFVANWPAGRAHHWQTLLRARAIENQAYVVGVNRVGRDGNGNEYQGFSSIFAPTGETLFEMEGEEIVTTFTLSRQLLIDYRKEFPFWMDADRELLSAVFSDAF